MKKYILIVLLTTLLIQTGCKKDQETDLYRILTSKSWEQIDGFYNGEYQGIKSLYKVTFHINGEYEFVAKQWGISLNGDTNETVTVAGKYYFIGLENKIVFESKKHVSADTMNNGCDTMQHYIADWHLIGINGDVLEIQGESPDTTNHAPCYWVTYLGKYYLKPYKP